MGGMRQGTNGIFFLLFVLVNAIDIVYHLQENEMIWSIGYRGLNDYPFWQDDPEINTDAKRAALISEAMGNQTQLVRNLLPNQNVPPPPLLPSYMRNAKPIFHLYLAHICYVFMA